MKQETKGWQWYQLDHMHIICTSLQTDNQPAPQHSNYTIVQQQQQPFYGPLSGTTLVSRYQKKHSPTHHPDHPIFISFFYLPRSIASTLLKLRAWQSFCTTSYTTVHRRKQVPKILKS